MIRAQANNKQPLRGNGLSAHTHALVEGPPFIDAPPLEISRVSLFSIHLPSEHYLKIKSNLKIDFGLL